MSHFKFIHIADLHLDVPMKHISHVLEESSLATFHALENLIEYVKEEKPDAVLFSGDIWNDEDMSLKARLVIKKACEIFDGLNIKVYIIHGNHDPLNTIFQKLALPKNVHVFGTSVESIPFEKDGETLALIHGISHSTKKETRNLSQLFPNITEAMKDKLFHICLLHTSLMRNDNEAIYAPCTLAELIEKNPHYWALGHVHKHQVLCKNPFIIYPGALQGTHINEEEDHGCVCVTMRRNPQTKSVEIKENFVPLAPLLWKKVHFEIKENIQDILTLQEKIIEHFIEMYSEIHLCTKQVILRLRLTGKTDLHKELRNIYILQELHESLNEQAKSLNPPFFIKDIEQETEICQEEKSIEDLLLGDDFLAQVLNEGENLLKADEEFLQLAIEKLYKDSPIQKQHAKLIPLPKEQDLLKKLVTQAQYICAQALEK